MTPHVNFGVKCHCRTGTKKKNNTDTPCLHTVDLATQRACSLLRVAGGEVQNSLPNTLPLFFSPPIFGGPFFGVFPPLFGFASASVLAGRVGGADRNPPETTSWGVPARTSTTPSAAAKSARIYPECLEPGSSCVHRAQHRVASTNQPQHSHSHSTVTAHSHSTVRHTPSGTASGCKHQSAADRHGHQRRSACRAGCVSVMSSRMRESGPNR